MEHYGYRGLRIADICAFSKHVMLRAARHCAGHMPLYESNCTELFWFMMLCSFLVTDISEHSVFMCRFTLKMEAALPHDTLTTAYHTLKYHSLDRSVDFHPCGDHKSLAVKFEFIYICGETLYGTDSPSNVSVLRVCSISYIHRSGLWQCCDINFNSFNTYILRRRSEVVPT